MVTQFSVLLHPVFSFYIQTLVQTHHLQHRPETIGLSDRQSQLLVYILCGQFAESNVSSLSPWASLFLCLYGYLFLQNLLFHGFTELCLWVYIGSAQPLHRFQLVPLPLLQTRPCLFSPRQNSSHNSVQALAASVFAVCLFLHVPILRSAIWKHLSFSNVMGFHSLVHKQTVSSLPWNILFTFIF